MVSKSWDVDIDALIAEHYAAKALAAASTATTPAKSPPLKVESQLPIGEKAPPEIGPSLSAALRALAVSPALPRLLERLAVWVETFEGRGS